MNPAIQKELDAAKSRIDYLVDQLTLPTLPQSALIDFAVHIYEAVKLLAETQPQVHHLTRAIELLTETQTPQKDKKL